MLQTDISTRTMIDVSDRIADNRNGQFGLNTEHIGSLEYSNKAVQPSAQSTVIFRVFVPCSHWLTANVRLVSDAVLEGCSEAVQRLRRWDPGVRLQLTELDCWPQKITNNT